MCGGETFERGTRNAERGTEGRVRTVARSEATHPGLRTPGRSVGREAPTRSRCRCNWTPAAPCGDLSRRELPFFPQGSVAQGIRRQDGDCRGGGGRELVLD